MSVPFFILQNNSINRKEENWSWPVFFYALGMKEYYHGIEETGRGFSLHFCRMDWTLWWNRRNKATTSWDGRNLIRALPVIPLYKQQNHGSHSSIKPQHHGVEEKTYPWVFQSLRNHKTSWKKKELGHGSFFYIFTFCNCTIIEQKKPDYMALPFNVKTAADSAHLLSATW